MVEASSKEGVPITADDLISRLKGNMVVASSKVSEPITADDLVSRSDTIYRKCSVYKA